MKKYRFLCLDDMPNEVKRAAERLKRGYRLTGDRNAGTGGVRRNRLLIC